MTRTFFFRYRTAQILIIPIFLVFMIQGITPLSASEEEEKTKNQESIEAQEIPDYTKMMLLNTFVPGTAQFTLGQGRAGMMYVWSLPVTLAGGGLFLYTLTQHLDGLHFNVLKDERGETTVVQFGKRELDTVDYALLFSSSALMVYGLMLGAYSQYEAHRVWMDTYGKGRMEPAGSKKKRLLPLSNALGAPFLPRNFLSFEVIAPLTFTTSSRLMGTDFNDIDSFFRSSEVDFWNISISPWGGLAMALGSGVLFSLAAAVTDEAVFRGVLMDRTGPVTSSIFFGFSRMGNILIPARSAERTIIGSLEGLGFGLYSAMITRKEEYNFEKSIALHFWNNLSAYIISYISGRETETCFTLGYRAAF